MALILLVGTGEDYNNNQKLPDDKRALPLPTQERRGYLLLETHQHISKILAGHNLLTDLCSAIEHYIGPLVDYDLPKIC